MTARPEKTWPEWTDFLGNTFRPGDYVVYASARGSRSFLTFAQVVRINRVNSSGKEILKVVRTYRDPSTNKVEREYAPDCTVTLRRVDSARDGTWVRNQYDKRLVTIQDVAVLVKVESHYMKRFEEIETAEVEKAVADIKSRYA